MRKSKIKEGDKYGRLTILEEVEPTINIKGQKIRRFLCQCECGNKKIVSFYNLLKGNTRSCGCLKKESEQRFGLTRKYPKEAVSSRLYRIWFSMKQRCYDSKSSNFYLYGGRGISVCAEWKNDYISFYNWAVTNGYSDSLSIDRINNNGNYEPSNCRWATRREQANNTRRNTILTLGNESHTASEWSRITNIGLSTILQRKNVYKWSDERTLTTNPKDYRNKNKK